MRVTGLALGRDGSQQPRRITAIEDAFALPDSVAGRRRRADGGWTDPSGRLDTSAGADDDRGPYYELVQMMGRRTPTTGSQPPLNWAILSSVAVVPARP